MKEKLKLLPGAPGCYLMKDYNNNIIYVGKAKNLKKRVRSYFIGSHNNKTTLLIRDIVDFSYVVTGSELEALVLELNLIKEHLPKYNIRLMDDKTYPYIVLTNEDNPRLLVTRKTKFKGTFFGPYPNTTSARETVRLLNMLYPLRKCRSIPKEECLYFHIHQCLAPCIKDIKKEDYGEYIKEITKFLKGDVSFVVKELELRMKKNSEELKYEEAKECFDMISNIQTTVEKQKISINDKIDRDIISYFINDEDISIYHLCMRNGKLVTTDGEIFSLYGDGKEIFINYLAMYYDDNIKPKELLLPIDSDVEMISKVLKIQCIIPKIGNKKKLIDMAYDNAKISLENKKELLRNKVETKIEALKEIEKVIGVYPKRIEVFDNSNILGDSAISGMVVYKDGFPSKKEYRKFHLRNLNGSDDYQSMREVIYRRYHRIIMDNLIYPDLIIVDGGKGQLNACNTVLKSLNLSIKAIGLKKDNHHKTSTIVYKDKEIVLDKNSNLFKFMYSVQEEVHRYAITFHKKTREKGMFESKLDSIKGFGPKKREKLWREFKTIEEMREREIVDYEDIGISKEIAIEIKKRIN